MSQQCPDPPSAKRGRISPRISVPGTRERRQTCPIGISRRMQFTSPVRIIQFNFPGCFSAPLGGILVCPCRLHFSAFFLPPTLFPQLFPPAFPPSFSTLYWSIQTVNMWTSTGGLTGKPLRSCITLTAVMGFLLFGYNQGMMAGLLNGDEFTSSFDILKMPDSAPKKQPIS